MLVVIPVSRKTVRLFTLLNEVSNKQKHTVTFLVLIESDLTPSHPSLAAFYSSHSYFWSYFVPLPKRTFHIIL